MKNKPVQRFLHNLTFQESGHVIHFLPGNGTVRVQLDGALVFLSREQVNQLAEFFCLLADDPVQPVEPEPGQELYTALCATGVLYAGEWETAGEVLRSACARAESRLRGSDE